MLFLRGTASAVCTTHLYTIHCLDYTINCDSVPPILYTIHCIDYTIDCDSAPPILYTMHCVDCNILYIVLCLLAYSSSEAVLASSWDSWLTCHFKWCKVIADDRDVLFTASPHLHLLDGRSGGTFNGAGSSFSVSLVYPPTADPVEYVTLPREMTLEQVCNKVCVRAYVHVCVCMHACMCACACCVLMCTVLCVCVCVCVCVVHVCDVMCVCAWYV